MSGKAHRDRERFAAVLAWVARQDEPFGVDELGGRFGLPRSSAHTMIWRLSKEGAIARVGARGSGAYLPTARNPAAPPRPTRAGRGSNLPAFPAAWPELEAGE